MTNVIHFPELRNRAERRYFMECLSIVLRDRALAYEAYLRGETSSFVDPLPEEWVYSTE